MRTGKPAPSLSSIGLAALCLLLLLAIAADGQVQFRARTDLVLVDVSVTDRDRRPVTNLQPADFVVLEDGVERPIAAFREIALPPISHEGASWQREVAADVVSNHIDDGRLIVIVLDDAATPPDAFMMRNVKRIARHVIAGLEPPDLAAVVFTLQPRQAQGFTHDRAVLLAAVDRFRPGFAQGRASEDALYIQYSLATLQVTASLLADVQNRRKIIVYVSPGAPVDYGVIATAAAIGAGATAGRDIQRDLGETQRELMASLRRTFWQAQLANVTVYPVDPSGSDGMVSYFTRGRRVDFPEFHRRAQLYTDFLKTIAEATGGRAVVGTNDARRGIDRMLAENRSYYLIGFPPSESDRKGRPRRIEVKVKHPGLTALARSTYYDSVEPVGRGQTDELAVLEDALSGVLPKPDIRMNAAAVPFATSNRRAAVAVSVGFRLPAATPDAAPTERIDLLVRAFTPDGDAVVSERRAVDLVRQSGGDGAVYEMHVPVTLDPGRYAVRVAMASLTSGLTASVHVDVDVPDFLRESLSLSGVALTLGDDAATDRSQAASPWATGLTLRRAFHKGEQVDAVVQVHEVRRSSGDATSLQFRIVDATDRAVMDVREELPFDGQIGISDAVTRRVELPVARLPPGDYLLLVSAKRGRHVATRQIRFTVA